MAEITDLGEYDAKKHLEELEHTNTQLLQRLAASGARLDVGAIVAIRLDLMLDRILDENQRTHFEVDFNLKLSDVLQEIARQVTFQTSSGLVIPK